MTQFHVFYIPVVFIAGLALGSLMGRKNALRELAAKERAERERQERRLARAATSEGDPES